MNILVFVADQLRPDHLGFGGSLPVRTPHIDGIAASGHVFDRAYVANPVCMPNRATIMRTSDERPSARSGGHDLRPHSPLGGLDHGRRGQAAPAADGVDVRGVPA